MKYLWPFQEAIYKLSIRILVPTTLDLKSRLNISLARVTLKPDPSNNEIEIRFHLKSGTYKVSFKSKTKNWNLI